MHVKFFVFLYSASFLNCLIFIFSPFFFSCRFRCRFPLFICSSHLAQATSSHLSLCLAIFPILDIIQFLTNFEVKLLKPNRYLPKGCYLQGHGSARLRLGDICPLWIRLVCALNCLCHGLFWSTIYFFSFILDVSFLLPLPLRNQAYLVCSRLLLQHLWLACPTPLAGVRFLIAVPKVQPVLARKPAPS